MYINVFLWYLGFFFLPAAGLVWCSRLRGTQIARRNTTVHVWALAAVRSTRSGGSKWQVVIPST